LAYQPPSNSTFLSKQTSHQQPASSTFLSEQTSISHQPPAKRTGRNHVASVSPIKGTKERTMRDTSVCCAGAESLFGDLSKKQLDTVWEINIFGEV
jgi:hypothetical protein